MGDTNLYGLISQGPEISCRRLGGCRFTAAYTPSTVRGRTDDTQTGFTLVIISVCVLLAINTAGLAYFGAAAVPPAALCSWLSCCSSIAHL